MQRFKNILVVFGEHDKDTAAHERAVRLAKENEARLTVVDVLRSVPWYLRKLASSLNPGELQKLLSEERREQLEEIFADARAEGITVETKVLVGTPFIEIIRQVLRDGHDLVVKSAEQPHGLRQMLFGSTDMSLLRKCPAPVWILKREATRPFSRILAAVDPTPFEDIHNELDTKILELATSLTELEGSELHVVHAWQLFGESLLRGPHRMTDAEVDSALDKLEREHKGWIDKLLEPYGIENKEERVHLVKGEPGRVIVEAARQLDVDLIIMGTVCRTGAQGLLIGNTAEHILNHVDSSVLTIKPEDFVSPVQLEDE